MKQQDKPRDRLWPRMRTWVSKHKRRAVAGVIVVVAALLGYYASLEQQIVIDHEGDSPSALLDGDMALERLKRDGDSRINILLMGKGGAGHEGGNLTDTIQVVSIDVLNNQVAMMSIPRDLYVASPVGKMKINAVYSTANGQKKDTGGTVMKQLVGEITDLSIHYFVVVDFNGFYSFIDLLGGVTVTVENPINDTSYPKEDGSGGTETFKLAAGPQTLDGATALKFVRSRHGTGGEGSDFARSARQQQVIAAIKDKALAAGLLSNPVKFLKTLNLVGDTIRTDISPGEMKLLAAKLGDIDTKEAKTAVLSNGKEGLLTDVDNYPGYTLTPRAGDNDYSQIQQLMHGLMPDPLVTKEAARIRVTGATAAQTAATVDRLTAYGYQVVTAKTVAKTTPGLILYRKAGFPYTVNYLSHRFSVTATNERPSDEVDIDLLVGQ